MRFASVYKPSDRSGKDSPWMIALSLPGKRRRFVTGARSRGDTERLADKLATIVERIWLRIDPPSSLDEYLASRKSLSVSASDYHDWLYKVKRTNKHADQMYFYAMSMIGDVSSAYHLTSNLVESKLAAVSGSSSTKKRHLDALKAFLTWGWRDRRWGREPLDAIASIRLRATRERVRRVLPVEQVAALIDAAQASAPYIATIYRVTLAAGLRAGELPFVSIDGDHLRLPPDKTKNRRGAWIRLPAWLAAEASEIGWPTITPANMARRVRRDLGVAGIPFETPAGVFDFHALRHQCGAMLASSGVPVKAIQIHMRHGSIRMTLDTYGHLLDSDRRATAAAVDAFCQRVAQRALPDSVLCGTSNGKHDMSTDNNKWSDGESNPDLLNAIQPASFVISLLDNKLQNKRGKTPAPRATQELLRRLFDGVVRRPRRSSSPLARQEGKQVKR